jgi:hypothetical protein
MYLIVVFNFKALNYNPCVNIIVFFVSLLYHT